MRSSFDHADGEALTRRDQLLSDMGVKFFREPLSRNDTHGPL